MKVKHLRSCDRCGKPIDDNKDDMLCVEHKPENNTKMKHTPGPWYCEHYTSHPHIEIWSHQKGCTPQRIAYLQDHLAESSANARLIAASTSLLFYLSDLIEQIEQFPDIGKAINMSYAKRAIAEAEGKEAA